jgi:hypothetical protein
MEFLLIVQIIYNQLTTDAFLALQQLMRNPNPLVKKEITEGQVRQIIGEPKSCSFQESVKICQWKENNREIEIIFNLINRNTISLWRSRGF